MGRYIHEINFLNIFQVGEIHKNKYVEGHRPFNLPRILNFCVKNWKKTVFFFDDRKFPELLRLLLDSGLLLNWVRLVLVQLLVWALTVWAVRVCGMRVWALRVWAPIPVEDMRQLALGLLSSHFKSAPGRLELLPVSWHWSLHTAGVDAALGRVSLDSIPKLRRWANDTLLDVLLYTSPVYCQTIVDAVGQRMNRLYRLFLDRNPSFAGTVALAGHSLGNGPLSMDILNAGLHSY